MARKIVIIGGVAGGATAAARLRRVDEFSQIIIIERGEHISFANCGLPYYIGGTIKEREDLLILPLKAIAKRFTLDVRTQSEVIKINRKEKTVEVLDLVKGEKYCESYDYLILSPGANPIILDIQGIEGNPSVFTLRSIPDADRIVQYIQEKQAKTAVVVGGGFIGLEMVENLKDRGLDVFLVEATNQVQPAVDYEMACCLHTHLKKKGVNLILEDSLSELKGRTAVLQSGKHIEADLVILAIGVQPENTLAVQAGLETGERGGIRVNEYLQTADESIYAIGDAIEVKDFIQKRPTYIPLAWPANRQGRLLADIIYGQKKSYNGSLGTSVVKVFDLTVASTGMNEKMLQRNKISYKVVHIHPNSHAGYYPGATSLAMKMTFSEDGKILGAQAVGYKGVEKRIDVLATAIKGGLSVYDLQDLELSYAPPYSSAKDPVNLLGYVAANILDGMAKTIQYYEVDDIIASGKILVDVSQPIEFEQGSIKGSINIPLPQLRTRLNELPKDQPIYTSCQIGLRGYIAARILTQNGYNAYYLDGGYRTYSNVYSFDEAKK